MVDICVIVAYEILYAKLSRNVTVVFAMTGIEYKRV